MTMGPQRYSREQLIQLMRRLAMENGLDPAAFVAAVSAPMGPLSKYEQDGDFSALMDGLDQLIASGNVGGATTDQRATTDPNATPVPPTGDGTGVGDDSIPFEETPAGQGTFTPSATTSTPATTGTVNVGPQPETNPFKNPSPDVVDPSVAAAARQPQNIPATPTRNPLTSGVGVTMGMKGVRGAPFGAIPLDQMNAPEKNYFFPFFNPEIGGASQAARNLAMEMGLSPQSGNPWSRYIEGMIEPLAAQAGILALLGGQVDRQGVPESGAVVPMVQDAINQGKTSVIDDLPGTIQKLLAVASGDLKGPGMAMERLKMADPKYAAGVIENLIGSTVSPYQRRQLRPVLQETIGGYYRDAPMDASLGPLKYLVGQMGY